MIVDIILEIQAVLTIRGHNREKRGKTASFEPKIALFQAKMRVLLFAVQDFFRKVTPANREGNLYSYFCGPLVRKPSNRTIFWARCIGTKREKRFNRNLLQVCSWHNFLMKQVHSIWCCVTRDLSQSRSLRKRYLGRKFQGRQTFRRWSFRSKISKSTDIWELVI